MELTYLEKLRSERFKFLMYEDMEDVIKTLMWEYEILNGTGEDKPVGILKNPSSDKKRKSTMDNLSVKFKPYDKLNMICEESWRNLCKQKSL